jgi:CRISPR type IV-associated protein Csf3
MIYQVTFHLDGTGVYYDPFEPIHLDALLAWCLAPIHRQQQGPLQRDDPPEEVPLPLLRQHYGDIWVWRASALFPEGPQADGLTYWRKRFRQYALEWTKGSPNLQSGVYREYNMPLPQLLCHRMVAWGDGSAKEARKLLKQIKHLGKKRAYGRGRVVGLEVTEAPVTSALLREGMALRWLPDANGVRLVRPRPPYWNSVGRVTCCEVGAEYGTR